MFPKQISKVVFGTRYKKHYGHQRKMVENLILIMPVTMKFEFRGFLYQIKTDPHKTAVHCIPTKCSLFFKRQFWQVFQTLLFLSNFNQVVFRSNFFDIFCQNFCTHDLETFTSTFCEALNNFYSCFLQILTEIYMIFNLFSEGRPDN